MGGISEIMTYCSLCHIHVLLLRELIAWECVVDNWDCSEVEAVGPILKEVVTVLYLKLADSRERQNLILHISLQKVLSFHAGVLLI